MRLDDAAAAVAAARAAGLAVAERTRAPRLQAIRIGVDSRTSRNIEPYHISEAREDNKNAERAKFERLRQQVEGTVEAVAQPIAAAVAESRH